MSYTTILSIVLLSIMSSAVSHEGCGLPNRDQAKIQEINAKEQEILMKRDFVMPEFTRQAPIRVPVNWHVVFIQGQEGRLTAEQIQSGITELNRWYTPKMNIEFYTDTTQYIDATNDPDTFNLKVFYNADAALRTRNHVGNARHLNIYTANLQDNVGGVATFPDDFQFAPTMDGVLLTWKILGGSFPDPILTYSWRVIIAHEVGHWLGLYHTFEGGCSDTVGDLVSDTPASAQGNLYCDVPVDSCPELPGLDPVDNLMDYCNEDCRQVITPGQVKRMQTQFGLYRNVPIVSTTSSSSTTGRIIAASSSSSSTTGAAVSISSTTSASIDVIPSRTTGRILLTGATPASPSTGSSQPAVTTSQPAVTTASPATTGEFLPCEGSCAPGTQCIDGVCVPRGVINVEDDSNGSETTRAVISTILFSILMYILL